MKCVEAGLTVMIVAQGPALAVLVDSSDSVNKQAFDLGQLSLLPGEVVDRMIAAGLHKCREALFAGERADAETQDILEGSVEVADEHRGR